jgi:Flp pilus assembly protein TadG
MASMMEVIDRMLGGVNKTRSAQRGSAMMELAVVLPLLLVTTVGLTDFGRAAFEAIEVENAAHAGAFYGARSKGYAADTTGIKTAALADMGDEVDTSKVSVESERYCECDDGSSIDCDDTCSGELPLMYVRVRVERPFETLLAYPGIPKTIDLDREIQLRVR